MECVPQLVHSQCSQKLDLVFSCFMNFLCYITLVKIESFFIIITLRNLIFIVRFTIFTKQLSYLVLIHYVPIQSKLSLGMLYLL